MVTPYKIFLSLVLSLTFVGNAFSASLPAFPGAEGRGALTIGGRGGQVIKVTNLNDSGAGSLREAIDTKGPRIVVFEVSGIINLKSGLNINDPYITIAGQTSPGGVLVTGRTTTINTHDVIIQHMRFRAGSHNVADAEKHDTIQVLGKYWANNEAYNIILDHCSIGWGIDENIGVSGGVTNMTIQWSIISEGLSRAGHPKGEHSKGLMISGKYELPNSVSIHHNYIAHNSDRNPYITTPGGVDMDVDVVNNIIYNWKGGLAPLGGGPARINWIHNYAKQGASSNSYSFEITHEASSTSPASLLYVEGNIGSTRLLQTDPDWNVGNHWMNEPLSKSWQKDTPWPMENTITTFEMSDEIAVQILGQVGATKPVRDSVDNRVVNSFINNTGSIIDNVSYPEDYPVFENAKSPEDADNDGMADNWEIENNLNTSINDANLDKDCDGYTNIEEYIHFLAGYQNSTGVCGDYKTPTPPIILE
jgi:hypothetical protein